MRAGDELEGGLTADGIDGDPEAAVLRACDIVVRLILVPGRALPRAALLGEHVIVVEPGGTTCHQLRPRLPQARAEDDVTVMFVLLPAAEVLDEAARIPGATGNLGARA